MKTAQKSDSLWSTSFYIIVDCLPCDYKVDPSEHESSSGRRKFQVSIFIARLRTSVQCFDTLIESLRFPQRGRQRERHNSFLCFPSKNLTVKIYHRRLAGQYISNEFKKSLRKKARRKPASGYQKKTKWIYRRCSLEKVPVES